MWRDIAQLDRLPRAVPPACLGHHGQYRGLGSVLRVERVGLGLGLGLGLELGLGLGLGLGLALGLGLGLGLLRVGPNLALTIPQH